MTIDSDARRRERDRERKRVRRADPAIREKERLRQKAYDNAHPEQHAEYYRNNPFQALIIALRNKHAECDLDLDWGRAQWTGRCEITGQEFVFSGKVGVRNPFSPAIARIDQAKGYTKANCQFVLASVKAMRGAGDEAMLALALSIIAWDQRGRVPISALNDRSDRGKLVNETA